MYNEYVCFFVFFVFSKKNVAKRNEKDEGRNEILTDGMKSGNDEQPLQRLAVLRRTQDAVSFMMESGGIRHGMASCVQMERYQIEFT